MSSDGDIIDLTVNTAEALPGDPMRVTWDRRAEGDPEILARTLSTLQYGSSHGIADTFARMQNNIGIGAQEIAKMQGIGMGAQGIADTLAKLQGIGPGMQGAAETQHRSVRQERPSAETDHFLNPDLPNPERPH